MWTSGLTLLFIFSLTLGSNNFQTVIDSEKCSKSTQNIGKNACDLKISAVSQSNNKKKFQTKQKKIKIFFSCFFKIFSFFLFLLTAPFLLVNVHFCVLILDAPIKIWLKIFYF